MPTVPKMTIVLTVITIPRVHTMTIVPKVSSMTKMPTVCIEPWFLSLV